MAKNLGLAAGSLLLSLVAVVMGSKLGIVVLGIDDPSFRYENQIAMWVPDPAIGFVNKPNLASVAWGNVPIRTNERGFRGNRPTATAPTDGVVRIAALGDSVMWGTGVREERAIPGLLARSLHADVINAGVVGYSTLQELRLLQRDVLALGPDVVLVNYCDNDALPTEDPFGNVRAVLVGHLSELVDGPDPGLTADEVTAVRQLLDALGSGAPVWQTVALFSARRPDGRDLVQKIFVKIPMTRMAQLSRDAGTRLVYVFVPPRSPHAGYAATVEDLRRLLLAHGAEVVDVQAALAPTDGEFGPAPRKRLPLDWVWPPELGQILTLWNIRSAHRRDKFLDAVHPTEIGNAIVAAEVGRHLATPVGAPDASRRSWREADSSCGPADTRSARVWR